ncbi:hypothetical protein GCM10009808_17370 [Microbacterium sediminicola]|uniref:Uncharacterized protein n=1 Tax=Microbacterium sediminicola TaxID=415210 RepID=A0ABN2I866_9MICO
MGAAEHVVTHREAPDAVTDRVDDARDIHTETAVLRRAPPRFGTHEIRKPAHVVPLERIERRGLHADAHPAGLGVGNREIFDGEGLRTAVLASFDGAHCASFRRGRSIDSLTV